jgi:uncharacterized surface protein with fasciclin (FAS1) repeats
MKTKQLSSIAVIASILAAGPITLAKDTPTSEPTKQSAAGDTAPTPVGKSSICEIVQAETQLETLKKALKAADLETTLDDDQSKFTLFAPTDAAFDKLPAGTLSKLLRPENKEKLRNLLLHHVVAGKLTAAELKSGNIKTLSGETIQISSSAGDVQVGGAQVSAADRMASNGVVHTINSVLVPDSLKLQELE